MTSYAINITNRQSGNTDWDIHIDSVSSTSIRYASARTVTFIFACGI